MAIGNLGSLITFSVSSDKVLTFDGMQRNIRGRWAKHEPIGQKPKKEFLGADSRTVSLPIFLSAAHGVKPRTTLDRIADAVENGTVLPFVVGGKAVGKNKWVITGASETWDVVMKDGRLVQAKVTILLEEYV